MRPALWLLLSVATAAAGLAALAGANMAVDVYGLYHNAHGRRLSALGDPRVSKYLLAQRYVPENFNAILSGSSVSANWDVGGIERLRVYNASLNGGNIVEERAIVESAAARGALAAAFLVVHPAMTFSHEFHTVEMNADLRRTALGSTTLLDAYKDLFRIRLRHAPPEFDGSGNEVAMPLSREMNAHMKRLWNAPDIFVDPVALAAYRELTANLRARNVRIVFIAPPIFEGLRQTKSALLEAYMARMRRELGDGLWLDFLSVEHATFRADRENFSDGVHMPPQANRQVVAAINSAVDRWIASGALPGPASRAAAEPVLK